MQKEIFQKLVEKMGEHCQIVPIGSDIDYRRLIAEKSVIQVGLKVFSFCSFYVLPKIQLLDFLWTTFLYISYSLSVYCIIIMVASLTFRFPHLQVHYFYPFDSKALLEFEKMWSEITSQYGGVVTSETIRVMFGR